MQVRQKMRYASLFLTACLVTGYLGLAHAQQSEPPINRPVDGIAAVVNDEVITLRQVEVEMTEVSRNLQKQNIAVPDTDDLQRQVLQRLIDERLLYQEASKLNLEPKEIDPMEAAQVIAARNEISLDQLQKAVEQDGLAWDSYLKGLRQEVLIDQIRQIAVDPTIRISDSEIDAVLKSQGVDPKNAQQPMASSQVVELAQILIRVPDDATAAQRAQQRQKAEDLLQQLRQGADFAGLAASNSDGSEALNGGSMGARPLEGWPDIFIKAIQQAQNGLTDVVNSGAGFHILKVLNQNQAQNRANTTPNDMMVTQTRAHHILIKLDQLTSDAQAKERIERLAARLQGGESFEDLARAYSEDATAPRGGDLGWLHPGETVPAFEEAMNALALNEISAPVRTQFGWHLIRVDERKDRNVGDEYLRMQARQMLHQQRVEPAFDDWLSQVRSQAFIDNRLDPANSSKRRN